MNDDSFDILNVDAQLSNCAIVVGSTQKHFVPDELTPIPRARIQALVQELKQRSISFQAVYAQLAGDNSSVFLVEISSGGKIASLSSFLEGVVFIDKLPGRFQGIKVFPRVEGYNIPGDFDFPEATAVILSGDVMELGNRLSKHNPDIIELLENDKEFRTGVEKLLAKSSIQTVFQGYKNLIDCKALDSLPGMKYFLATAAPVQKAQKFFEELKKLYFPELPNIEVLVIPGVEWLGQTVKKNPPRIEINEKIAENGLLCRRVLAHEMVHLFLFLRHGKEVSDHGEIFQEVANKINQSEGDGYIGIFGDELFENPENLGI